jgi:hypothetical protein
MIIFKKIILIFYKISKIIYFVVMSVLIDDSLNINAMQRVSDKI